MSAEYMHIGIPITNKKPGMTYNEGAKFWVSNVDDYDYKIEYLKFEEGTAKAFSPLEQDPAGVFTFEETLEIFRKDSHALLDARPHDRWLGLSEPVDARPGRIPGSVSLPASRLLKDGRLRSPEEIRAVFAETLRGDDRPVLHYCGSGIAASLTIFAARLAGLPYAGLYPGSWSEWCVRSTIGESGESMLR